MAKPKFTDEQILKAAAVIVEDVMAQPLTDYLKALLITLWEEEEGFSGKRPFGNSGWTYDVYKAFIKAELIKGELDPEHGWVDKCDDAAGLALVLEVIKRLVVMRN